MAQLVHIVMRLCQKAVWLWLSWWTNWLSIYLWLMSKNIYMNNLNTVEVHILSWQWVDLHERVFFTSLKTNSFVSKWLLPLFKKMFYFIASVTKFNSLKILFSMKIWSNKSASFDLWKHLMSSEYNSYCVQDIPMGTILC